MTLDLSKDFQLVDDTQPITYFVKVNEGTFASGFTISGTYWTKLTQLDYMRNPALLQQQSRAVHVWTQQMSGIQVSGSNITPKMGDKVVDSLSLNWYATQVEYMDIDRSGVQRYRLTCYQET